MSSSTALNIEYSDGPALTRRYETLIRIHRELEDRIGRETARPAVDGLAMQEMKRRKLRIKDALAAIERTSDRVSSGPAAGVMPDR